MICLLTTTFHPASPFNHHIVFSIAHALFSKHGFKVKIVSNEDVYTRITVLKPSVLIVVGSIIRECLDFYSLTSHARSYSCTTIFWSTDDPYEIDCSYRIDHFDFIYTNDKNALHYYGGHNVNHLPLAADVRDEIPVLESVENRDLFFCGYPYANRRLLINELHGLLSVNTSRFPFRIVLAKGKWGIPESEVVSFVDISTREQLLHKYNQSWVTLNVGRTFNIANRRNIIATTPGPRTFEAAIAGACQIFIGNASEITEYFSQDTEILWAYGVSELLVILERINALPKIRRDCAVNAQKTCRKRHLYDHRVSRIVDRVLDIVPLIDNRTWC